ncbi:uncharacterized protein RG961_011532 isoform 2-T2 [Leptosomus discolor]
MEVPKQHTAVTGTTERRRRWEQLSSEEVPQWDFGLQALQGAAGLAGEGRAAGDQEAEAKKVLLKRWRKRLSRCRKPPAPTASWCSSWGSRWRKQEQPTPSGEQNPRAGSQAGRMTA